MIDPLDELLLELGIKTPAEVTHTVGGLFSWIDQNIDAGPDYPIYGLGPLPDDYVHPWIDYEAAHQEATGWDGKLTLEALRQYRNHGPS